jgi:hypothetical protein
VTSKEYLISKAEHRRRRAVDIHGSPVDIFPLPADEETLETLLRDLFENHWREITFGPIIQGAAYA